MTEREALRYRDAVRLQHTYQVIYDRGAQRTGTSLPVMRSPGVRIAQIIRHADC